jgi:hypothetical protein
MKQRVRMGATFTWLRIWYNGGEVERLENIMMAV